MNVLKLFNLGVRPELSQGAKKRIVLVNYIIFIPFLISIPGTGYLFLTGGFSFPVISFLVAYCFGMVVVHLQILGQYNAAKMVLLFHLTFGTMFTGASISAEESGFSIIRGFLLLSVFIPVILFEKQEIVWRIAGMGWILVCLFQLESIVRVLSVGLPSDPALYLKFDWLYYLMQFIMQAIILYAAQHLDLKTAQTESENYHLQADLMENLVERRTREVEQINQKLKSNFEFQRELLHVMAHELKNPLQVVLLCSERIKYSGKNLISDAASIEKSTLHMVQIIDDLLITASRDSGNYSLEYSKFELNDLLKKTILPLSELSGKKKIKLINHTDGEFWVYADPRKIEEVFENLIGNAIKFSPKGKNIALLIGVSGNSIRFEVSDQGPGMTQDEVNKLFAPFSKLKAKPTGGEKSSGLGLSIAKRYIDLHEGRIGAFSQGPGSGTTFFFELPSVPVESNKIILPGFTPIP